MSYRAINQCLFPWNKKKGLLAYNNNFYLLRLAAEAITYARPTIRPNAKGIHTPKLCVLTFICCIKLPRNSISLIAFQQVEYKVYISDFWPELLEYNTLFFVYFIFINSTVVIFCFWCNKYRYSCLDRQRWWLRTLMITLSESLNYPHLTSC